MTPTRTAQTGGIVLTLVILAWHIFPQAMNGGYPNFTPLFYGLLVIGWVAFVILVIGLVRVMRATS